MSRKQPHNHEDGIGIGDEDDRDINGATQNTNTGAIVESGVIYEEGIDGEKKIEKDTNSTGNHQEKNEKKVKKEKPNPSAYPKELNPFAAPNEETSSFNGKNHETADKILELQRIQDALKKAGGKPSAVVDVYQQQSSPRSSYSRGISRDEIQAERVDNTHPQIEQEDKNKNASMCSIRRWISPSFREAREISYISIVFTLASFIADVIVSIDGDSTATLSAGLDSLLDVISSLFVIWRFYGGDRSEAMLEWKEKVADFSLSLLFLISSSVVMGMAIQHLIDQERITDEDALLESNIPSFVVLFILACIKYHIARALQSETMIKDAIGSFSGAGVSLGVCIGVFLELSNRDIWWVDAAIAVAIAVWVLYVGLSSLCRMGKWWTRGFWRVNIEDEVSNQGIQHL